MLNKKVMIVSLGCDKNLVDTEKMLGILADEGCTFTDDEAQAQVIIVNTCCFIGDAKEESIQNILDLARFKTEGKLEALIATGCLSQRYQDEMLEELPELDGILGISAWHTIADVVREALEGKRPRNLMSTGVLNSHTTKRLLTTGGHYAYLKIAEGCNKRCTYCVIPSVRGAYVSVPMEELEKEARELAAEGVKELILVAQETTVYGIDLYKKKMLPELLHRLCAIPGIVWIRLLYCYPEEITPELVQVMKEEKKICHYLDMPIQHSSDRILKKMGRRTNRKELLDKIEMLRTEIPDIVLRTTLITGFPGETQEDFEEMLNKAAKDCDYIHLYDKNGHLYLKCSHHDGTNYYEIKKVTDRGVEYLANWKDNWDDNRTEQYVHNQIMERYSVLPHFGHKVYCWPKIEWKKEEKEVVEMEK